MAPLRLSSGANLPADISECANANMTYDEGPFCPDFNITFGKHTYSKTPLSASDENTTMYEEEHDYIIWRSEDKDKEGAGLCFPKSKSIYTDTTYPDGSIRYTAEGSSAVGLEERDTIAEGITAISKPGTFYQEAGSRTVMVAPDYSGTVEKADGTFIDVCKLLSSSGEAPSPASASTCDKCPESAGGGDPFAVTCACSADKTSIECEMNCSGQIVAGPWIKCNTLSTADVCGNSMCASEVEYCALGNVEGCPDTYDPENKSAAKCLCEGEDKCDSFILKDATSAASGTPAASAVFTILVAIAYLSL